jgi:hypothetical protein
MMTSPVEKTFAVSHQVCIDEDAEVCLQSGLTLRVIPKLPVTSRMIGLCQPPCHSSARQVRPRRRRAIGTLSVERPSTAMSMSADLRAFQMAPTSAE